MSAFSCRFVAAWFLAAELIALGAAAAAEPAKATQPRLDRFGDPLPEEVLYRVGATRFRLGWPVAQVVFSKDGKTLYSVDGNAILHWDTATGKQLRKIETRSVSCPVLLSPDGKLLAELYERYAYKSANKVGITEASTGRFLRSLDGRRGSAAIAFAPDSRTLAAAEDEGTIYLWDATTGKALGEWKTPGAFSGALAFSPDGKELASAHQSGVIRLWNVRTRRELRLFRTAKDNEFISSLVFSADGKLLAAQGGDICLWDTATGRIAKTLPCNSYGRSNLAFSPDGKILASDTDYGVVCLWDVATGKEIRRVGRQVKLSGLTFSPDGAYLAVAENNIRLYRVADGAEIRPAGAGTLDLDNAVFSPDGRLLVTTERDGVIRLWDADTGAPLRHFKGRPGCCGVVAFSADGLSLFTRHEERQSYRDKEQFFQWDLRSGKEQLSLATPSGAICAALSSSGRIFAWASKDGVIHLRDVGQKEQPRSWPNEVKAWTERGRVGFYPILRFSAQDKQLGFGRLFGGQSDIRAVATGAVCSFATKGIEYLSFSADGRIAARLLPPKNSGGLTMQWRTFDDEILISFHDTTSGDEIARIDRADVAKQSLGDRIYAEETAFSPDGHLFVTWIRGSPIRFWETATGKECYRLPEASGLVEHLAFAPDGNKVVTVGASKIALVWRIFGPPPGQQPAALSAQQQKVLWADLASADASVAFGAMHALTASAPSAVALLQRELHPIPRLDAAQRARWIAELDSEDFTVREKASVELEKRGLAIEGALRKALRSRPTLEVRKRLEALLEKLYSLRRAPATIRQERAIEVLEHLATPEARKLLQTLAAGEPQARSTGDAKASLERLNHRPPVQP